MEMFTCPLCALPLCRENGALQCTNRHSFDLAREGYVNLLAVQHRGSKAPGDNPQMIAARRRFLDAGYYQPLRRALLEELHSDLSAIADLGCGDGYFSVALLERCEQVYGVDVSRAAIKAAARRNDALNLAVASSARLPFAEDSFDAVTVLMAPLGRDTLRILKPGGCVYRISAAADHLRQLKALLYPEVRPHRRASVDLDACRLQRSRRVGFEFTVSGEHLLDLVAMTPMQYRVGVERREAVERLTELVIDADFYLDVFSAEAN